eukprot:SAG31_NODE_2092_length_6464_cov_3.597172_1_plen_52_part_10
MLTAPADVPARSRCLCGACERAVKFSTILRLLTVLRLLARFSTALVIQMFMG